MAVLLASLSLISQSSDLIWLNVNDAVQQGVTLTKCARFHVWTWTKDSEPVAVTLGDTRLASPSSEKPKGEYAWRKLGDATLEVGTTKVATDPFVATLVLAADPRYDPADAMQHIRVYNRPDPVADRRAETYRDSYTYHIFPVYSSREDWEKRAEEIRLRMRIAGGLVPMPERTPLNARIFDEVLHDDYVVAKVAFESCPGFLVTGNLYTPKGTGPFPAVLCPHGHWKAGRLEDSEKASVPARCITFARMGMLALSYDMIGFQDSKQFPHEFVEPRGKLWAIDSFALQLWNSIRAVDFVQSLPSVDKNRIGCTGGSGGGTQTFALYSVDDRISVAAPVNIISCSTQADCSCESPPIIRMHDISDMEIGATMAPRPLLMVSATGDWTVETPRVEYPAIRSIYTLYDTADEIESVQFEAGHNYNKVSREAVYRFFGKWLLGQGEKYRDFVEPPYTADPAETMRIFPGDQGPTGYPSKEEIVERIVKAARARWKAELPTDPAGTRRFRDLYAPALLAVLGAEIPEQNALQVDRMPRKYALKRDAGIVSERLVLRRKSVGDGVPMILYRADDDRPRDAVLIVHGAAKAALADLAASRPGPLIRKLLEQGKCVAAIDAFLLGEHNSPLASPVPRATGSFPDTFEPTDTACRVQDVITSIEYLRTRRDLSGKTQLIGLGDGGIWCLFAAALDDHVERLAIDANKFANEDDNAWVAQYYIPSIRSLGDVITAAALIAPRPLLISNTGDTFATADMQAVYAAVSGSRCEVTPVELAPEALAEWFR
jgi:hypothetical protein